MNNFHQSLLDNAIELDHNGNTNEAIALYQQIITLSPDWATPYYNLGLIYKYRCEWEQSFNYNQKAAALNQEDEAAWWNIGIASTALNNWETARKSWNFFGLNLEINQDELIMDLGKTPVRLNPDNNPEVIWAKRIDPARTIIISVPLPESNHRYNDLLLNDGAPVGSRISDGIEYAVFNELQLLKPSFYKTFSIFAETNNQDHINILAELCDRAEIGMEDWSTIRLLCKQCSEGTPHEQHDHVYKFSSDQARSIGLAATNIAVIEKILQEWYNLAAVEYTNPVLELE